MFFCSYVFSYFCTKSRPSQDLLSIEGKSTDIIFVFKMHFRNRRTDKIISCGGRFALNYQFHDEKKTTAQNMNNPLGGGAGSYSSMSH